MIDGWQVFKSGLKTHHQYVTCSTPPAIARHVFMWIFSHDIHFGFVLFSFIFKLLCFWLIAWELFPNISMQNVLLCTDGICCNNTHVHVLVPISACMKYLDTRTCIPQELVNMSWVVFPGLSMHPSARSRAQRDRAFAEIGSGQYWPGSNG